MNRETLYRVDRESSGQGGHCTKRTLYREDTVQGGHCAGRIVYREASV